MKPRLSMQEKTNVYNPKNFYLEMLLAIVKRRFKSHNCLDPIVALLMKFPMRSEK